MKRSEQERGYALLAVVVITAILLVTAGAAIELSRSEIRFTTLQLSRQQAFYAAEAGVQRALIRLNEDNTNALASTGYSWSLTDQTYGPGTYSVTVSQDAAFPNDPQRKEVRSVGRVSGYESTVVAKSFVQGACGPSTMVLAGNSSSVVSMVNSINSSQLFDGIIFSGGNLVIRNTSGARFQGTGTMIAGGDFIYDNQSANQREPGPVSLYRGGVYRNPIDNPPTHDKGPHFLNGTDGHGQQVTSAARRLPRLDYRLLKRDTRTVLVSAEKPPYPCTSWSGCSYGSWNASTKTWEYPGTLNLPTNPKVIYYVSGNAKLGALQLSKDSSAAVVARGVLAVGRVDLYRGTSTAPWVIAQRPNTSSWSNPVITTSTQTLHLYAEKELVLGRLVTSMDPLMLENGVVQQDGGLLGGLTGIITGLLGSDPITGVVYGFDLSGVATNNRIFAFSENAFTWMRIKGSAGDTRVNLCARGDATMMFEGTLTTPIGQYDLPADL
jgi:Tfp pilus assembly protein PilX